MPRDHCRPFAVGMEWIMRDRFRRFDRLGHRGGHKSPSHQGTSLAEPLPSFYFNDTAMVATMIGAHRGVNIAFQHT